MNRDDDVRFISRDRVPREAAVGGPSNARYRARSFFGDPAFVAFVFFVV